MKLKEIITVRGTPRPLPKKKKGEKTKKQKGRSVGMRANGDQVLAQSTGQSVKRAFGSKNGKSLACWDAKTLAHLPLPRPVGPYTTVRYTTVINTAASDIMFGTFKDDRGSGSWHDICAVSAVDSSNNISAASNTRYWNLPMDPTDLGALGTTGVPSALSVQIMNPEALQTTTGILYAGVMNTQAAIEGRDELWSTYFNRFVAFMAPRLMSAGKLALRGVNINSYPLSMNQVSEFTRLKTASNPNGVGTMNASSAAPCGWAPILVHNPSRVELVYLVTMEWRIRFDLTNPASAGHVLHPLATDHQWGALMKGAAALGHGVLDLADVGVRAAGIAGQIFSL